jgi:hypothetical protein
VNASPSGQAGMNARMKNKNASIPASAATDHVPFFRFLVNEVRLMQNE